MKGIYWKIKILLFIFITLFGVSHCMMMLIVAVILINSYNLFL